MQSSPYKLDLSDKLRYLFTKTMTWLMYHIVGVRRVINWLIMRNFEYRMEVMMKREISDDFLKYSDQ